MPKVELTKSELTNRFIFFFIMRTVWKQKNRPVEDLYQKVFPSKRGNGGNRTLYTNILNLTPIYLDSYAKEFTKLTGIPEAYFLGAKNYRLRIGMKDEDSEWQKLIELQGQWRKSKTSAPEDGKSISKPLQLINQEKKIISQIENASQETELRQQSEQFKKLVHFATFGHKQSEMTAEKLMDEVERAISNCSYQKLSSVDTERLLTHLDCVETYVKRVSALQVLKKWCQ